MSQDATENPQPISDLATMISRGRSFSGRERNCVFLNLGANSKGAPTFANVSAGSGFDFPDDARAIALADWDHDGDLDLWVANRNGPRLRLMRNELPPGRRFLSLRLQGDGQATNRDAIGARVEVMTPKGKLIRTVRAGEGFAAQSSKWLHVGLGWTDRIESVTVRWPNRASGVESFTGVETNGRYLLVQGTGKAIADEKRPALALAPSVQPVPPVSRSARIPMVQLLKAPELKIGDGSGKGIQLGAGKPVLVSLWASWCAPCLVELKEIAKRETEIRAAGIDVVALSVDVLNSDDPAGAAAEAGKAIRKLEFPFVSAMASERIVGQLQWHHDNAVGHKRRLPLPSSFLIDARGFVSVIYKGPLSVDALLADVAHSAGTRRERWLRAAPIGGRAIESESVRRTVERLDANLFFHHAVHQESLRADDLAAYYYEEALRNRPESARAHRGLGNLSARRKMWKKALSHFEKLIALLPKDAAARYSAAACHRQLGQSQAARARLEETIELRPDYVPALDALATLDLTAKNARGAIRHFSALLDAAPQHLSARNNLAWILATCNDDTLRDGKKALKLAGGLVKEDGGKTAPYLDTLAAAQAENGMFAEAAATARRGLEAARKAGDQGTAAQIAKRIPVYERGEAIRE